MAPPVFAGVLSAYTTLTRRRHAGVPGVPPPVAEASKSPLPVFCKRLNLYPPLDTGIELVTLVVSALKVNIERNLGSRMPGGNAAGGRPPIGVLKIVPSSNCVIKRDCFRVLKFPLAGPNGFVSSFFVAG